jgi:hypothetical protein
MILHLGAPRQLLRTLQRVEKPLNVPLEPGFKDSKTLFPQCFGLGLAVLDSFLICRPARERLFQQADPETEVGLLRCGTMTPAIGQQEAKDRGFLEEALTCPGG